MHRGLALSKSALAKFMGCPEGLLGPFSGWLVLSDFHGTHRCLRGTQHDVRPSGYTLVPLGSPVHWQAGYLGIW